MATNMSLKKSVSAFLMMLEEDHALFEYGTADNEAEVSALAISFTIVENLYNSIMEEIEQQRETELGRLKTKLDEEFHTKVMLEEQDRVLWDPRIMGERLKRSSSFVCSNYHQIDTRRPKPKFVTSDPWQCQSQALRQLSLVPRFGPKMYYINNTKIHNICADNYLRGASTQSLGLCYDPKTVSSL